MDWTYILGTDPAAGITVILSLILIEGILSVDNAAVLATMVMRLPEEQRGKALKYGIIGAYVFRGICLALVAWLMSIWWLEPIGGLYLLFLAWKHFARNESAEGEAAEHVEKEGNWLHRHTMGRLGPFWATVVAVEIMDLAFSLDNVFAAVAFTKNKQLFPPPSDIVLVCIGVFIGILAMRFAAQGFVKLMHKFPFLEKCAYLVIGILGIKLLLSVPRHFLPEGNPVHDFLASKYFDLGTSAVTILIFIVPVVVHRLKHPTPTE
ncbi:TerC family protein [Luteolibacter arcticus]|uniref:TerC family protein n=1 Tax=Luteolibacter arcticus TaxID=1581411 RepID=A0ABT3GF63_9BACT|nr:TerC family protein [Luteolibacter arcticus]MCW1922237.1 TerC family protein [Luteolibacter arcticus]